MHRPEPHAEFATTVLARLLRDDERMARVCTIDDVAALCALEVADTLDALGGWLDSGDLEIEFHAACMYLRAPHATPGPTQRGVAATAWEFLRRQMDAAAAEEVVSCARALERSGWEIEFRPRQVNAGLVPSLVSAPVAVRVAQRPVPVEVRVDLTSVSSPTGMLSAYESAGAAVLALVAPPRALDRYATAVRHWMLSRDGTYLHRSGGPALSVLVLEAPGFNPTLLSSLDPSVPALSVDRRQLDAHIGRR